MEGGAPLPLIGVEGVAPLTGVEGAVTAAEQSLATNPKVFLPGNAASPTDDDAVDPVAASAAASEAASPAATNAIAKAIAEPKSEPKRDESSKDDPALQPDY